MMFAVTIELRVYMFLDPKTWEYQWWKRSKYKH